MEDAEGWPPAEPFAEGMLPHEKLELADELVVAPGRQIGRDPRLECSEVLLLDACRLSGQPGVRGHSRHRLPPPQCHRSAEQRAGAVDAMVAQSGQDLPSLDVSLALRAVEIALAVIAEG